MSEKRKDEPHLVQDEEREESALKAYLVGASSRACRFLLTKSQRVFTFGTSADHGMFAIVIISAFASGAGIALQNLIFGSFVTHITDFATGVANPEEFRRATAELA